MFPSLLFSSLKERCLFAWQWEAEVFVGKPGGDSASGGSIQKTDLDQEWLVYLFQSIFFFRQCSCQGIEPHRPAIVFLNDGQKKPAVDLIEAVSIHFQQFESSLSCRAVNNASATYLGVVAYTP